MIQIQEHKLVTEGTDFRFDASDNHSGLFSHGLPDTIVMHYTAGASYGSSVNWLKNKRAKASAHLVVGRKGEVVQLVPFNSIAWHAGQSQWRGRVGLNKYSIGIEIANAGLLERRVNGYYTSFGRKVPDEKVVIARHKHHDDEQAWEAYTSEQIEIVEELCVALMDEYPIKEIVGHDDIAPKRKKDPGPAFPLEALRNRLLYTRADDEVDDATTHSDALPGIVTASLLNIRHEPGLQSPTVSEPLRQGTRITQLQQHGNWIKIKVELEGWVKSDFVKLVE